MASEHPTAEPGDANADLPTLLAFQPIYGASLDLWAYELLVEDAASLSRALSDIRNFGSLIAEPYTNTWQDGQLVSVPCVLKLDSDSLMLDAIDELSLNDFIIDVDASLAQDAAASARLQTLARAGFRLALSGVADSQSLQELLPQLHMVRVDFCNEEGSRFTPNDLESLLEALRPHGLKLLADGLQSPEDFRRCLDARFDYFQGDFFPRPETNTGKVASSSKVLMLQLLAELENPQVTIDRLERLILQDANLTYQFIKVVNSASYGMSREIETLSHALGILGTRQIRSWVSMFLLEGHDDRPAELVRSTLVRGRMCEIVAEIAGLDNPISYFIAGLLSHLDVLTGIAMPDLMDNVALKQEIKEAILRGTGTMGTVLREVEGYQNGDFSQLSTLSNPAYYETAYRHSTAWALQLQEALYS